MKPKLKQEELNEILKSKGYKIISINYFSNYYTYYIRKLEKEKITSKDYFDLYKIKGALISYVSFKDNDFYIEFDIKKVHFLFSVNMKRELENILEDCKVGYEMYPLYCKLNNMVGKEKKKNITVDYSKIDNVDALIKLRNFYKKYNFEEELEEIQYQLDNKLVKLKKYAKYCQTIKGGPIEVKYYSHILEDIEKLKDKSYDII